MACDCRRRRLQADQPTRALASTTLTLLLALVLAACGRSPPDASSQAPPPTPSSAIFEVTLQDDPIQTKMEDLEEEVAPWHFRDFRIVPLVRFEAEARILSASHYSFDDNAKLVKVDLALGWGPMSEDHVLEKIDISQSNRFYFWHTDDPPIPLREIETHSANMHLIPANEAIEDSLEDAEKDEKVRFRGYLVRAERTDGWRWQSSLTREDTGNGSCELVWVEKLERF